MGVPRGRKPQECERNAGLSKPSIPYTPEHDVIQEALGGSRNTLNLKLALPEKVELHVTVWS